MVRTRSGQLVAMACALVGLGGAALPGAARAWTNAQPASADAHVHVWPSGRALVRLTVELEVRGGWLSEFEIAGLDEGAVLDPDKPPWLLRADGAKVAPRAVLRPDGTLRLSFARSEAPRRGRHLLGIAYFAQLATSDAGARRVSYALPAWRVGLERVSLWINAPASSRFVTPADALELGLARAELERGSRRLLHLERPDLPRTVPFGAELELTEGAAPLAVGNAPPSGDETQLPPLWLGAIACALALLKRWSVHARAAHRSPSPRPLVPMRGSARTSLMVALGGAGSLLYPRSPGLGLVCLAGTVALALYRDTGRRRDRARPAGPLARATELFGAASWFDATTPPGLLLLATLYGLAALRVLLSGGLGPWFELLLCVTPLWLTGTRLHVAKAAPRAGLPGARPSANERDPVAAPRAAAGADRPVRDRAA